MVDTTTWLLFLVPASVAGMPLTYILFRNLPSGGVFLAKPLGILLATYLGWILLFTGQFNNGRIYHLAVMFGCAAVAVVLMILAPAFRRERIARWRVFLLAEAVFAIAFVLFALYRSRNPEIWGTEKPMDMALMTGIIRSPTYPPLDPWLSGFGINYYYFGYAIAAGLTWLSGVDSPVGFNLALGTFLASAFVAVYSLGFDLIRLINSSARWAVSHGGGFLAAVMVMVAGNLYPIHYLINADLRGLSFWKGMGWDATRVVQLKAGDHLLDYTINEFPAFSFILGDLHPHVMALPFTVIAMSVAIAWLVHWSTGVRAMGHEFAIATVTGWLLGALYVINSWDFPSFLVLVTIGGAAGVAVLGQDRSGRRILRLLLSLALATAVAAAAYFPFHFNFEPFASGVRIVEIRSSIAQFLTIFGLWILVAIVFLAFRLKSKRRVEILVFAAGLAMVVVAWFVGNRTAVVVLGGVGAAAAAGSLLRSKHNVGLSAVSVLYFGAFGLAAIPELIFIKDFFGPPYDRMNTVFKLYYQVWPMIGIASIAAAYWIYTEIVRRSVSARIVLAGALAPTAAALVAVTMIYPVIAGRAKAADFDHVTLDGLAYADVAYGADIPVIDWLRENAPPDAVILEAAGKPYTKYGRVSAWTGIPTLVGWIQHENLWRNTDPEIAERVDAIDAIYSEAPAEAALKLLHKYGVTHVFVGSMEREKYGFNVLRRFSFLTLAFESTGGAQIYLVPRQVNPGAVEWEVERRVQTAR